MRVLMASCSPFLLSCRSVPDETEAVAVRKRGAETERGGGREDEDVINRGWRSSGRWCARTCFLPFGVIWMNWRRLYLRRLSCTFSGCLREGRGTRVYQKHQDC